VRFQIRRNAFAQRIQRRQGRLELPVQLVRRVCRRVATDESRQIGRLHLQPLEVAQECSPSGGVCGTPADGGETI